MKVALFLKDEMFNESETEVIPIIVLHLTNNAVAEIEKDIIVKRDINYLSLWLLTKQIKEVYVMDIDPVIKRLFENLGVTVRKHNEIMKNPLLKEFLS